MKKIGILGGTFNPPHIGHLIMANEVQDALKLDEIWFMPTYVPPHKATDIWTQPFHRLKMIEVAIVGHPSFSIQRIEFERRGKSYTYETMKILREQYPNSDFHFIIGADMIESLSEWHRIDELLHLVTFVGVNRPGYSRQSPYPILQVEAPTIDLSSSLIREKIKKGQTIRYLVPDEVEKYIEENHLYGS
ncbi:nicotinate-nucleotide adenylyltransferase [Bacillus songklensis]|uniref:Probable nicotinate-nucleotide adenylyltransferase n=1 Tax=Bacillus songklensis TaxID=1069116 RepID=A0ABV8AZV2_9BACI